jgi:hypothetical protein
MEKAGTWRERFRGWADLLREDLQERRGASGEAETLEQADLELLIALMRARHGEEQLREQTRLAEREKENRREYGKKAEKLSELQYDLARELRPLERRARSASLRQLIELVGGEMMNAGMYLRRPQTDSETIAIQTEIIELLADSISGSSGGSGAGRTLMSALGMGGGSEAGGDASGTGEPSGGRAAGSQPEDRDVEKSGGADTGDLPEEFRNVLEAYFRAIEESRGPGP